MKLKSGYEHLQQTVSGVICVRFHVSDVYFPYDTNGLLTEREVCTVKYQTEDFSMDRATKERGPCKKQRSDISQYRPNKRGQ